MTRAAREERRQGEYVERIVLGRWRRRLFPNFWGKVVAVIGTSPPYTVTVIRSGETSSDGNTYAVAWPYVPAVGDIVQIEWLDSYVGVVTGPVGLGGHYSPGPPAPKLTAVAAMTGLGFLAGSTDHRGRIAFTNTGALAQGAALLTLGYSSAWPMQPFVVCSESSGSGAVIVPDYNNSSPAAARFAVGQGGLLAAHAYVLEYHVEP